MNDNLKYILTDFLKINPDSFNKEISDGVEFSLSFPLSSIGFSNSRIDIIRDYTEVSYCCEEIAPFITILNADFVTREKYYKDFKISCKAKDIESLTEKLVFFAEMLHGESSEYDDIDRIFFLDELSEYEETYSKRIFTFPDLINNYWANLINGAYWEFASENEESESKFFAKTYRKYPEHRYGFWKSPLSKDYREPIFFSTENWIIPPKTPLIESLKIYSGLEHKLVLEEADRVDYKGQIVLVSNSTAVRFIQEKDLINSIKCTERALIPKYNKSSKIEITDLNRTIIQNNLLGEEVIQMGVSKRVRHNDKIQIDYSRLKYKLSEYGDLVVIEYNNFTYVFFYNEPLTFNEIKDLNSYLYPAFSKTQKLIENSITGACDWTKLDDDSFEELCYDILYCHPHFDYTTIKKMGKSKSRDGGRDITIKTRRTPTKETKLYIFQCKFLSEKTSLSTSKLPNAGNVIMQFGAKGYGVFTTTVVDSTLYDMLDGFSRNLKIDTSLCWSKYELERYLNKNIMIKNKYFK
jgi:hypothetical protein